MSLDPLQALQAAGRPVPRPAAAHGTLLMAGAAGPLGNELLRRLAGTGRFVPVRVLVREAMRDGLRGVESVCVPAAAPIARWPLAAADTALVCFDPPRAYHGRERALWVPAPQDLPELARWLRDSGVRTLAIVQPHAQGRLPEALKRGLASLDEHAVVALGFERVLLLRSAQKPADARAGNAAERLAAWMLSVARFMVPAGERPVRPAKVAELVEEVLRVAPPGVHVAPPELVWAAAQGQLQAAVARWLAGAPLQPLAPVPRDAWKSS